MNKERTAKLELLRAWAARHGYVEDRFGHFIKTYSLGTKRRYKVQSNTIRLENWNDPCSRWIKYRTAWFSDFGITADDKLTGFK